MASPSVQDLGTLVGGGDCLEHYHNSDRLPPRDSMVWFEGLETVVTYSINTLISANDDIVISSAAITLTLPLSRGGKHYIITSTTIGTTTIVPSGTNTISTLASTTITGIGAVCRLKSVKGGWVFI